MPPARPSGLGPAQTIETAPEKKAVPPKPTPHVGISERDEESVPMSLLRRRVAERLVQAQQAAALLTTFNEIDMTTVMALRQTHQEAFQQRHGVKLKRDFSFSLIATIYVWGQA